VTVDIFKSDFKFKREVFKHKIFDTDTQYVITTITTTNNISNSLK